MTDDALLELARAVATEAAALVRTHRAGGVAVAGTKSSAVDVVTEADRASEALIRTRIAAARPDDAILGEEGGSTAGASGVRWIVDPIDGTVNFLYGIGAYAVSIAAERDGEVVAGVVHDVASDVQYAARLGAGAWRDDQRLQVRPTPPLAERLVLTGFSYSAEVRAVQAAALARLLPRVRDIRRFGSCALDLCRIAEGSADGYVEEGVQLWDHAAGALVAREAGARFELAPGAAGGTAVLCAPAEGFADFCDLIDETGFLAPG